MVWKPFALVADLSSKNLAACNFLQELINALIERHESAHGGFTRNETTHQDGVLSVSLQQAALGSEDRLLAVKQEHHPARNRIFRSTTERQIVGNLLRVFNECREETLETTCRNSQLPREASIHQNNGAVLIDKEQPSERRSKGSRNS